MRVPKAGNGEMSGEEEVTMVVEMERAADDMHPEGEVMEKTGLRDEEGKEEDDDEEERRVDEVIGRTGHLSLLLALLISVALLAIGFLVKQVSHFFEVFTILCFRLWRFSP